MKTKFRITKCLMNPNTKYARVAKGTIVKVINITDRGYDIEDEEGNKILEIGWVI